MWWGNSIGAEALYWQDMGSGRSASRKRKVIAFELDERLDAGAAIELRLGLLEVLERQQNVALSADKVEQVSTQAVQVIVAAARSFASAGLGFTLKTPSPVLGRAFADLGLADELAGWAAP